MADQFSIKASYGNEFIMWPAFYDAAILHHKDFIGCADCRKTMGNDDGRSIDHQFIERVANMSFTRSVQMRRTFVEDQHRSVVQECASDGYSLSLPAGQLNASLSNPCFQSGWQRSHKI